jgi:S-methylmethionine-dependent homocysteine/selenocysteine methylase
MAKYRSRLPQLSEHLFLTDAGIETTLIFHDGFELPYFAAFPLLEDMRGKAALDNYFRRHAGIARDHGVGFILESATWRASEDWGGKLGYSALALDTANRKAIEMLHDLRAQLETDRTPMIISGCIGPRGDGYDPGTFMTPEQAADYHSRQVRTFAQSDADQVTAITMTNSAEAIGIARAAAAERMPSVVSFTVETDGRLSTGQSLAEAIIEVDAATGAAPAYYMINCAHPTHFEGVLAHAAWARRLRGVRANASRHSHAELDMAEELDDGDPMQLGEQYAALRRRYPWINVLGGCCGTDHRHIARIVAACNSTAPEGSAA